MDLLAAALRRLPAAYAGPGGAVAVLRNGEVLARHAWGWADIARRLPFTPSAPFPICSITKQFTCALLLDLFGDPAALDPAIAAAMPALAGPAPKAADLCHNQSGLRDYWATAMLCGAPVEGAFGPGDAATVVGRTQSLHFTPGTRYSYCNQNFRLLADAIEARTGRDFAALLRDRVFDRAGMTGAALSPRPEALPGGMVGYEGSAETGFRAAVNRIHWTGDAGITASLDDLIAWERTIDAERDDPAGLHTRLAGPARFADGRPAFYRYGLARMTLLGRPALGHAGGLRGWRSQRVYLPAERISVVVLFNHMASPRDAAVDLLRAVLATPAASAPAASAAGPAGTFIEPETGLLVRLQPAGPGKVRLTYGQGPELLDIIGPGEAAAGTVRIRQVGGTPWMDRGTDGQSTALHPLVGDAPDDVEGRFHSPEFDATLTIAPSGGALYGAFSGVLGQGEMLALLPAGADTWLLPCPRALDYAAPGDWTLRFQGAGGPPTQVTVGCWLARQIPFHRV